MKKNICKILVMSLLLAQGVFVKEKQVNAADVYVDLNQYTLVYEDNFEGNTLNTDEWFYRESNMYHGGYNRRENISVSDGKMHIAFKKEDFNNDGTMDLTGGGIISKQNFGYGYYETECTLYGGGNGLHSSFWTMGLPYNLGQCPGYDEAVDAGTLPYYGQSIEIDGLEADSNSSDRFKYTVHRYQPSHSYKTPMYSRLDITSTFKIGFEYLPGMIKWYVNRKLVRTQNIQIFGQSPQWFTALANNTISGGAVGSVPLGAKSSFEYFRYYNKKEEGANRITNGNYEYITSSMNRQYPLGWLEYGDSTQSTVVNTGAHTGSNAMKHHGTSDYTVTTKQHIENIPNGIYRLTAWVKSSGGQDAKMRVLDHGSQEVNYDVPASSTWTQITIDDVAVTNGNAVIAFTSIAQANQWLEVDDVVFSEKVTNVNVATVYECESLTRTTSGDAAVNYTDPNAGISFNNLNANAINDYVEYTVNVPEAGSYTVLVNDRTAYNKGIYQLEVDGNNVGTPVDLYVSATGFRESNLGTVDFTASGNKQFKFQVTGKNNSSTGYQLAFDYIKLVKN